jgi:hypothetical protein
MRNKISALEMNLVRVMNVSKLIYRKETRRLTGGGSGLRSVAAVGTGSWSSAFCLDKMPARVNSSSDRVDWTGLRMGDTPLDFMAPLVGQTADHVATAY